MRILATSGGFLPTGTGPYHWRRGPLIDHALELSAGGEQSRICYLGTAGGDSVLTLAGFYRSFAGSAIRASHLELFSMPNVDDLRRHLVEQDVIWVGGG